MESKRNFCKLFSNTGLHITKISIFAYMVVTFLVDDELKAALEKESGAKGVDTSKLIRAILKKHFKIKDKKLV